MGPRQPLQACVPPSPYTLNPCTAPFSPSCDDKWNIPEEIPDRQQRTLITISTSPKSVVAALLPKILIANTRSLMPKIDNFCQFVKMTDCKIAFISEVWEKSECRLVQAKVEEMLELKGLQYISSPRPPGKRGGGVALIVDTADYTVTELQIAIPYKLECLWTLVKKKNAPQGMEGSYN